VRQIFVSADQAMMASQVVKKSHLRAKKSENLSVASATDDLPKTELQCTCSSSIDCDKGIKKERRRKAHLEDFGISHQLFHRVLGIKSISTKDLQTTKRQTSRLNKTYTTTEQSYKWQ